MKNTKDERPEWAYKDYFLINKLYVSTKGRCYIIENLEHNFDLLSKFTSNDVVFVLIGCYYDDWNFKFVKNLLISNKFNLSFKNIVWMCNNEDQYILADKYGFDRIMFNHNSLINENIFDLVNDVKLYNLAINCRPDVIKRPWLANKIDKIAVIQGASYFSDRFWDLNKLNPLYINKDRISAEEIIKIYGKSFVGGIFSEKEGACYASSEYLLCGLPVVSTYCTGGREFWYNEKNSLIVNPDEYDIKYAVYELINKLKNKLINPSEIRNNHIEMANIQRINLFNKIQNKCSFMFDHDRNDSVSVYRKIMNNKVNKINQNFMNNLFDENN
jgi:glycosyltransferase involved in cell wall biosynthesis